MIDLDDDVEWRNRKMPPGNMEETIKYTTANKTITGGEEEKKEESWGWLVFLCVFWFFVGVYVGFSPMLPLDW
jgi:hypothetical protein